MKVMSLRIRSAGLPAWAGCVCVRFLKGRYHEMLLRHVSVSLFIGFSLAGRTLWRRNEERGAGF